MSYSTKWITLISVILTAISVILGVIAFLRQQKINRLQNLISVFQRFSGNDDFLMIFDICDACYVRLNDKAKEVELGNRLSDLKSIPTEKKFKYLALLEEISIYAKNSAVMSKNAIHLFKFHFHYLYGDHMISEAFWDNLGSGKSEKYKEGWSYQMDFAKICTSKISS